METQPIAGRWTYEGFTTPYCYGGKDSYWLGMSWLTGCAVIEDWGCGCAYAKNYTPTGSQYVGVDGSPSQWTAIVDNLEARRSQPEGLFMRHVLEHNPNWRLVLANALTAFTRRMSLITFLPLAVADASIGELRPGGSVATPVPNIRLSAGDLWVAVAPYVRYALKPRPTEDELVFLLEK